MGFGVVVGRQVAGMQCTYVYMYVYMYVCMYVPIPIYVWQC